MHIEDINMTAFNLSWNMKPQRLRARYPLENKQVIRRSDRLLYAYNMELLPMIYTTSVLVMGIVSKEDYVMSPLFFLLYLRVNITAYNKLMETVVKPWIKGVAVRVPVRPSWSRIFAIVLPLIYCFQVLTLIS